MTERRMEYLRLIADGLTNEEIAARLWVSVNTVRKMLCNMFTAMDARNRAHAVALGFRDGTLT